MAGAEAVGQRLVEHALGRQAHLRRPAHGGQPARDALAHAGLGQAGAMGDVAVAVPGHDVRGDRLALLARQPLEQRQRPAGDLLSRGRRVRGGLGAPVRHQALLQPSSAAARRRWSASRRAAIV